MSQQPVRARRWIVLLVVVLAAVLVASCGGSGSSGGKAAPKPVSPSTAETPGQVATPARENVAFYYQPIRTAADATKLGPVDIVVSQGGAVAAKLIHATGARAYRYIQTYWFPVGKTFDWMDIAAHPADAFCGADGKPVVGRTDFRGQDWWFLDLNERSVRDQFLTRLKALHAQGWDGVFMDRGFAALTGIDDPAVKNIWNQTSTCTEAPIRPGATFADAYVEGTRAVREAGLQLMLNYGVSPLDPDTALRPDSHDPNCVARNYAQCRHVDDVWGEVNSVLNEGVSHPLDVQWPREYDSNRAAEKDPTHPGRVVGLITQSTLGGTPTREGVYFEWSKVKLFRIPLAVGTGDDGCPGKPTDTICNRQALYPELSSIGFGAAIDKEPQAVDCAANAPKDCLWTRGYAGGMSVANVRAQNATLQRPLGVSGCRYVKDVWAGQPLADNRCVSSITLDVPAWSGRPLVYSTKPW